MALKGHIAWNKGIKTGRPSWMTGKHHTQESKEKLRLARLGKPSWNKGIPRTEEEKKKMSENRKGIPSWNKGRKSSEEEKLKIDMSGLKQGRGWNKGKHPYSEETKQKMRVAKLGIKFPNRKSPPPVTMETRKKMSIASKGRKKSFETRRKMSLARRGEKNNLWKGGITQINFSKNLIIRNSLEYKLWRDACYARDGYTCQKYGIKGGKLAVHHILNFASHTELRFAIDNGITFSKKAHIEFHHLYGKNNNTREQVEEFIGRKLMI